MNWPEGAVAYFRCSSCGQPGVWLRRVFKEDDPLPCAADAFRDDGQQLYDGQFPECQHCRTRIYFWLHDMIVKGEDDGG